MRVNFTDRGSPPRPELSSVALCAFILWVCTAITLLYGHTWDITICIAVSSAGIVIALIAVWFLVARAQGRQKIICICFIGFAVGVACGAFQSGKLHYQQQCVMQQKTYEQDVQILSDPLSNEFGQSCYAVSLHAPYAHYKIYLPPDSHLMTWDYVHLYGSVQQIPSKVEESAWNKGYIGCVYARSVEHIAHPGVYEYISHQRKSALHLFADVKEENHIQETYSDGVMVLQAIVCGWRADLFQSDAYENVKSVGLAHLVAVSGAHLVLMSGFLAWMLRTCRVSKKVTIIVQIVFISSFIIFTGAPLSVLRASTMTACALLSFFAKRRTAQMHALGFCVALLICINPQNALSISFALSAAATAGILLFSRYFEAWFLCITKHHAQKICSIVAMTCAATMFTLPISSSTFSQLPLISPLSNIIATPFFSLLCSGGLVAIIIQGISVLIAPVSFLHSFAMNLVYVLTVCAHAFLQIIDALSKIPYACIPFTMSLEQGIVCIVACAVALLILWPRPHRGHGIGICMSAVIGAVVCIFILPVFNPVQIVALDVGQGDAILLQSNNHAILVDAGKPHAGVIAGLARHHVTRLDAVIISHHDDDHYGGITEVLRCVPVQRVYIAKGTRECSCASCKKLMRAVERSHVQTLSVGDTFTCGHIRGNVLAPAVFHDKGGNQDSLVLSVELSGSKFSLFDTTQSGKTWHALLTGDAESETLKDVVYGQKMHSIDILKVGHHGSRVSLDDDLVRYLSPTVSLISVGEGNRYGHPHEQTLNRLFQCGSYIGRTDEHGDISCVCDGSHMRITTQR